MSPKKQAPDSSQKQGEVQFTVTYDGNEPASGRMNAQALGAAIVSMGELIETSATLIYGTTTKVSVDVVADFKHGSFAFDVAAAANLRELGQQLIQSIDMGHVLTAIGITGGSGGLIGLVRWLRRRPVKDVKPIGDNNARVTTVDGDSTVVHAQTAILLQNSTIRINLDGVVEPLRKEGITEFRAGTGGQAQVSIRADEADLFEPPLPQGELLQDKESEQIVQIVGMNFDGRKWRFRLADGTAFTSHFDQSFAKQVGGREVLFGNGDALEVILRTVVVRDSAGSLHAQREIVRVIKHLPPPKQMTLDFGDGSPVD